MTVLSKQKVLLTEQEIEEQDEEIDITTIDDAIPGLNWEQGFATLLSENDLFRMGHYRLYKHELLRNAFKENNDLLAFADYFDEKNCEKLNECADMIWENICDRTDEMDKLMKIATEREPQLLKKINKEIKGESLKYYVKFFVGVPTKMDMIVKTLEPIPICERLNDTVYEHIVTRVRKFMANGLYDEASCYMMRSLPHVHRVGFDDGEWYFDFMEACQYDSANRTIPEFVDPDHKMRAEIHQVKCRLSCDKIDGSNAELSTMMQFVEPSEEVNQEFRPQELYLDHRQKVIDKIGKIDDPDPLELRQYQEELVEMACSGKNTIICAPTGSGKTIVATYVIIDHLQKKRNNNEAARVAMFVPTVPLVDQQCEALNLYMRKKYWIEGLTGSEAVGHEGRAPAVLASDVTIFTPQVFVNLLNDVRKGDRLYFTDFTLFVFDECHHCDGGHPYNVLMHMLDDFMGTKPQIVGLTASVPVGSGRATVEVALDHIVGLCARLDAESITTVRKHIRSLEEYVSPPIDEIRTACRLRNDPFILAISNLMTIIESEMKPVLEKYREEMCWRSEDIRFPSHTANNYQSFIGALKKRISSDMKTGSVKYELIKKFDHLGYYYQALTLSDLLPNQYAYEYLLNKINNESKVPVELMSNTEELEQRLKTLFHGNINREQLEISDSDMGENKEILKLLYDILREQYKKDPLSRTIIFVTTRMLAEKLSEHLNECRIVVDGRGGHHTVGYVTSSNQSSPFGGQTALQQREMIGNFNGGYLKILVATSVAEEGLDISACNLIIKYNNIGSERTLIQRRGRARAKNSRAILLALDEVIERQELENIRKEELMRACLKHIQTKSVEQIRRLIKEKTEEYRHRREQERKEFEKRRQQLQGKSYNICCRVCHAFVCKSTDMRVACESHYVCCDPSIWSRTELEYGIVNSKAISIAAVVGTMYCKSVNEENRCNAKLGKIIRIYGVFLPTPSSGAIFVDEKDNDSRPNTSKKWGAIARDKFFIRKITEDDLKKMTAGLSADSKLSFETAAQMAVSTKKQRKRTLVNEN